MAKRQRSADELRKAVRKARAKRERGERVKQEATAELGELFKEAGKLKRGELPQEELAALSGLSREWVRRLAGS
jgi:hypothetical protein